MVASSRYADVVLLSFAIAVVVIEYSCRCLYDTVLAPVLPVLLSTASSRNHSGEEEEQEVEEQNGGW